MTREGLWIGPGWIRVARASDEDAGVLARETEIKTLAEAFARLEAQVADCEAGCEDYRR